MVKYQVLKSEMDQYQCVHSLENEYHLILTLGLFSNNLSRRGKVLWNAPITDFMMPLSAMNFVFNVLLWSLALFWCFDFSDHWALMSNWDLSFFLYILGVWIFLTLPHFPLLLIRDICGILHWTSSRSLFCNFVLCLGPPKPSLNYHSLGFQCQELWSHMLYLVT